MRVYLIKLGKRNKIARDDYDCNQSTCCAQSSYITMFLHRFGINSDNESMMTMNL